MDWSLFKNTFDLGGETLNTKSFGILLRALSKTESTIRGKLIFCVNVETLKDYKKFLDSRATCCGGGYRKTITPFGVNLAMVEDMPDDKIVLSPKDNIVWSRPFRFKNPDLVFVAFNFSRFANGMDPAKLDIFLKFGGNAANGGMKITGRDNIIKWMKECKTILERLEQINKDHDLAGFYGVRCESSFEDFKHELLRAYTACEQVLKIPF